jgi:hypothetical protein
LARGARAAQQLCDTLWEALHEELLHPSAERVALLSERLAEVCSTVAMLAAAAPHAPAPDAAAAGPPATPSAGAPAADPHRTERRTPV